MDGRLLYTPEDALSLEDVRGDGGGYPGKDLILNSSVLNQCSQAESGKGQGHQGAQVWKCVFGWGWEEAGLNLEFWFPVPRMKGG